MGHSIAARYAARPTARFVRPSSRARERRLGLTSASIFSATTARPTTVHGAQTGALIRLRGLWRGARPVGGRVNQGPPRPSVRMIWTRSGPSDPARRARAATAPWRA
ncbi:MAG: hypothetical protein H0U37_07265 [Chloroflexi bacterium]|nr:hypothetical protein [Chloroflexota bacterium]